MKKNRNEYMRNYTRERYQNDPDYRQRMLSRQKECYQNNKSNPAFRAKQKARREVYHNIRRTFFADKECQRCHSKKRLLLHHIDPSTKVGITSAIWGWADIAKREREIAKCEVLCDWCHRSHHGKDKTNSGPRDGRGRTVVHGTTSGYSYGCRCDQCRGARYGYKKQYDFNRKQSKQRMEIGA